MTEQPGDARDGPDVLEGWSCEPLPVVDSLKTYELDAMHARMRAVVAIGPSIAAHVVTRAVGTSDPATLLRDVRNAIRRRGYLGMHVDEVDLVFFQLRMLLLIPTDAETEEQGADDIGGDDVLSDFPNEPLASLDPQAPFDLRARAGRIDAITAIGKAIAEHLIARHGPGKPGDPSGLMHKVWEALNRREWLGLSREESGILLFQLHFMLGASVL